MAICLLPTEVELKLGMGSLLCCRRLDFYSQLNCQSLPEISWFAQTDTNYIPTPAIFWSKKVPQESQSDAKNFIGWNYHCIERLLDSNQIG